MRVGLPVDIDKDSIKKLNGQYPHNPIYLQKA
jgi:hypothetical protein